MIPHPPPTELWSSFDLHLPTLAPFVAHSQNEPDKALELYEKALVIFKKSKGENSTEVATVLNGMAFIKEGQVGTRGGAARCHVSTTPRCG